jgi:hypothetical protein
MGGSPGLTQVLLAAERKSAESFATHCNHFPDLLGPINSTKTHRGGSLTKESTKLSPLGPIVLGTFPCLPLIPSQMEE